jgi:hypothetical protein
MAYDNLPEQIQWKLYRAKQHYEELVSAVGPWMNGDPGQLVLHPDSTPENPLCLYTNKDPIPAYFSLIAGDFLQNLRSVMDYLVWQLIVANGNVPHKTSTGFPVCKSHADWEKASARKINGASQEAMKLLETLQPYPNRRNGDIPLPMEVLDELTNENKHRQLLFTSLATIIKPDEECPFPHIELEITRIRGNKVVPGERLLAYLVFKEGIIKGIEVTRALGIIATYMDTDVLPLFKKFFR